MQSKHLGEINAIKGDNIEMRAKLDEITNLVNAQTVSINKHQCTKTQSVRPSEEVVIEYLNDDGNLSGIANTDEPSTRYHTETMFPPQGKPAEGQDPTWANRTAAAKHITQAPVEPSIRKRKLTPREKKRFNTLDYGKHTVGLDPVSHKHVQRIIEEDPELSALPRQQAEKLAMEKAMKAFILYELSMGDMTGFSSL